MTFTFVTEILNPYRTALLVLFLLIEIGKDEIFIRNNCVECCREETDSVCETRDSFSDSFSDESESEKLSRWDGCSSEEGDSLSHLNDRLGYLYFQYFERSPPYGRVPLMDKVHFPCTKN